MRDNARVAEQIREANEGRVDFAIRNLEAEVARLKKRLAALWNDRIKLGEAGRTDPENPLLSEKIEVLGLSCRPANGLHNLQVFTIGQLVLKRESELRGIPNMGKISIREIKEALALRNLSLAPKS